jgi:hypothetical protein
MSYSCRCFGPLTATRVMGRITGWLLVGPSLKDQTYDRRSVCDSHE